ncbi:MAG: CBS domain-containing protein [Deltaproteobacteria bacterium]|nr:CBS domain-containing protein [Deltaproteobacteria bacterium]
MNVGRWMKRYLITVQRSTPLFDALELMKEKKVRRLPVMEGGKLVGIVTRTDLLRAAPSEATTLSVFELKYLLARKTIEEFMTPNPHTVTTDTPIEVAALLMRSFEIGALPVTEKGKLVGIITESDIFDALVEIMGIREEGVRLIMEIKDKPGKLAEILNIIKKHGINIMSVASCKGDREGWKLMNLRLKTKKPKEIAKELEGLGYKLSWRKERGARL